MKTLIFIRVEDDMCQKDHYPAHYIYVYVVVNYILMVFFFKLHLKYVLNSTGSLVIIDEHNTQQHTSNFKELHFIHTVLSQ